MKKKKYKDYGLKIYITVMMGILSLVSTFILVNLWHNDSWILNNGVFFLPAVISILSHKRERYKIVMKYMIVLSGFVMCTSFLLWRGFAQALYIQFISAPFSDYSISYLIFSGLFLFLIISISDWHFYFQFIVSRMKSSSLSISRILKIDIMIFFVLILFLKYERVHYSNVTMDMASYLYGMPVISKFWIVLGFICLLFVSYNICRVIELRIMLWESEFYSLPNLEQERYDSLFESANIISYAANLNGDFIRVSKGVEKILGYSKEELLHKPIASFYENPKDRELLVALLQKNAEVKNHEIKLLDKSGELHYLSLHAKVISDQIKGNYLIGIIKDMTVYKEVKEKSEKYQQKYKLLFDKMLSSCIILEPVYGEEIQELLDVRLINANPYFFKKYYVNRKRKELLNNTWQEINKSPNPDLERYKELLKKKEPITYETYLPDTNQYMLSNIFLLENDKIGVIFHDITHIKQEEILQKKNEEKYRLLFEKMLNGVVVMEPIWRDEKEIIDVTVVDVNPAGEKIMESPKENIVGYTWTELFGYKNRVLKQYERIMNEDIYFKYDYFHPVLKRYLKTVTFRLSDTQLVGIFEDVTYQIVAENEINHLNSELERKVEDRTLNLKNAFNELESFSYMVSHDLKSPLRAISTYGQFLVEDSGNDNWEENMEIAQSIMKISNEMIEMVDKLLRFSTVTKHTIIQTKFGIEKMILEVCKEIANVNPDRKIEIQMNDQNSLVSGDEILMRLVVSNIISNAVKFSKNREETVIRVNVEKEVGMTVISFKDNGIGFDIQYVDKLYHIFQRLHATEEFEGSGIGLATIKKIMERHGGKTWIESEYLKGTIIYIALPS